MGIEKILITGLQVGLLISVIFAIVICSAYLLFLTFFAFSSTCQFIAKKLFNHYKKFKNGVF